MTRPAAIARDPFVLRHAEVARDYFRQSPTSLTPERLRKLHPTFPLPHKQPPAARYGLLMKQRADPVKDRLMLKKPAFRLHDGAVRLSGLT